LAAILNTKLLFATIATCEELPYRVLSLIIELGIAASP